MTTLKPAAWRCAASLLAGLALNLGGAEPSVSPAPTNSVREPALTLQSTPDGIWKNGVGAGFRPAVQHVGVVAGAGPGMRILGSSVAHDLALAGLSYGRIWGDVKGEGRFYRGNWEWRTELFGGGQIHPKEEYLVGLSPHVRYNFATGTRIVPFVDVGAGVTATDIGGPDLSGAFQFNLQAGAGVNWFLRDNMALSLEYRYLHLSNARISTPNLGVNTSLFLAGISWFF